MNESWTSGGGMSIATTASHTPSEPPKGFQLPLDMTEVWKYDALINEITTINNLSGPLFMQEFLRAKDIVSSYHAKVMFEYEQARDASNKAKSIAYLERAPQWLEQRSRKVTEEACKRYSEMDQDYLAAREIESYLKSLLAFLTHKLDKFQCAHDDAKKIFDKTSDPMGSRGSLPSGQNSQ
jgi:hypothetical protein